MRVLILGAGGFLGSRLATRLTTAGHQIVLACRNPQSLRPLFPTATIIACDLATDRSDDWLPRLAGIDAVINAAGILHGTAKNNFANVHTTGPCQLFEACAAAKIPKLIQISAQGADASAISRFHLSKRAADDHLVQLADRLDQSGWIVLRPALVVGRGGKSTALFSALAALPFPIRIGAGDWTLRPLHITDFLDAVEQVLNAATPLPRRLDLVGPAPLTTDEFTRVLRRWLGFPPARFITLPPFAWRIGARIGDLLPLGLLSTESLGMLKRGHPATPEAAAQALNWRASPLETSLAREPSSQADRYHARLHPLRPALTIGLSSIWLSSGLISAFAFPITTSTALVQRLGIPANAAGAVVYAGAAFDFAIGVALLTGVAKRFVGCTQLVVMALYTALATFAAPALWLDPFGPLTKNIAVFLAVLVWIILEDAR